VTPSGRGVGAEPPAAGNPPGVLFRGIDRAAFVAALASKLRRAGVGIGLTNVEAFVRALDAQDPDSRARLYWLARVTLVHRREEIEIFDRVFASVFDAGVVEIGPHARRRPLVATPDEKLSPTAATTASSAGEGGLPWATLPAVVGTADGAAQELLIAERLPSDLEHIAEVPFEELDANELTLLEAWFASALARRPTRLARRREVDPTGPRVALRATLARSRRNGWEPIELVRERPRRVPRSIVMVCDVSQSMQAHTSVYLHLMRAAASAADAEVFAFATSLSRLTPLLVHRSAERAIEQASAKVGDRFGGTRIAASLRALLRSHYGDKTRGAVVIVASDGWDADNPGELAAVMARLHRRAHRIVWLNPRSATPGYEPLVGSMAAALSYCDAFLPVQKVSDLEVALEAIFEAREAPVRWLDQQPLSSKVSRAPRAGSGRR
jgi:uncharacterized protein